MDDPRHFRTQAEWERWLAKNYGKSPGVWLCIAKKESGERSVTYAEALDSALCYGWIDAQKQKSPEPVGGYNASRRAAAGVFGRRSMCKRPKR